MAMQSIYPVQHSSEALRRPKIWIDLDLEQHNNVISYVHVGIRIWITTAQVLLALFLIGQLASVLIERYSTK